MIRKPTSNDEFGRLLILLLDGELSAEDRQRLNDLLRDDPAARSYCLRYLSLESQLHVIHEQAPPDARTRAVAESGAPSEPDRVEYQPSTRSQRPWTNRVARQLHWKQHPVYYTAAVAVLSVCCVAIFVLFISSRLHQPQPVANGEDDMVARVVWVDNPWWEGFKPGGRGMRAGQQLVLRQGLAELHYTTGAIVILEGPAEFTVGGQGAGGMEQGAGGMEQGAGGRTSNQKSEISNLKSNSGFLKRGKLVARCGTRDSQGFTVATPHARVRDLGTEFAVAVQDDGAAEVEVISGEVELVAQSTGGGAGQRVRLTKTQGAAVEAGGRTIAPRGMGNVPLAAAVRNRLRKIGAASAEGDAQAGLFRIDLSGQAGSAAGWDAFSTTCGPTSVTDLAVGGDSDVTLAIASDTIGIQENAIGTPGATVIDGIAVPAATNNDYIWCGGSAGTSVLLEFAHLDAGTYNVSVFEGRTSDNNGQFGKVWVGTLAEEPGSENTGNFAGSSATRNGLTISAGDRLFYRHLEDNTGGTSGIIVRRTDVASEPSTAERGKEPE